MTRKLTLIILALATTLVVSAQNAKELYAQGKELYEAKNYAKAVPLLQKAADKGNKKAQYRLGRCYEKGHGVTASNEVAVRWYTKSAAQDYYKAQYRLGKCYLKGKGTTADAKKAKTLLKKATKNEKHGDEVVQKLKQKAREGDDDAQAICNLLGVSFR